MMQVQAKYAICLKQARAAVYILTCKTRFRTPDPAVLSSKRGHGNDAKYTQVQAHLEKQLSLVFHNGGGWSSHSCPLAASVELATIYMLAKTYNH